MAGHVVLAGPAGSGPPPTKLLESVAALLPPGFTIRIPTAWDAETLREFSADADAMLATRVSREMILSAPNLRLIQTFTSGADGVDIDAATERGVVVCSMAGENAVWVAEHAFALMLAVSKNLGKHRSDLARGVWGRMPSAKLQGKTLGIVGLGRVGCEAAKRARAFGMRTVAIRRHPEAGGGDIVDRLGGPESLEQLLRDSDYVLLSTVLTEETKGMLGEERLAIMKRGAALINVARGSLVDERALVDALRSGALSGAGLDVFEVEPISAASPLLALDNVILTPHVGGGSGPEEELPARAAFLAENIQRALTGGKPRNVVDPVLKYVRPLSPT